MQSLAKSTARRAAEVILAGPFDVEAIAVALARLCGGESRVTRALAARLVRDLGAGRRPCLRDVARFLEARPAFRRLRGPASAAHVPPQAATMQPAAGAPRDWVLPPITTLKQLAAWLSITPRCLRALTRGWREAPRDPRHDHYHRVWIPRRGRPPRLIEAPKERLRSVQRRILEGILAYIPVHEAAHGFVRGRDTRSFVAAHVARRCVLRLDVQDFFVSLRSGRVVRVFLSAGYPEPVARALAHLCTTATPKAARGPAEAEPALAGDWPLADKLRSRHLPQGAPTSPALANLCCSRLDLRLRGLARAFAASYSRYADDFLFSGGDDFARVAARCEAWAAAILIAEGLRMAHRKTRLMHAGSSQRAAGLVLNAHAAIPRERRDRLEAILTNCARSGPAAQNRSGHPDFRAHLRGRIADVARVQPRAGARLLAIYARIDWGEAAR